MLRKKIISLGLAGLLSASLLVGCGNTKVKTESSKPEQPKQEQKVVFDEVIADNEYIKMTLVGKEKNEYGAIALKVLVENKTDDDLLVSTENLQVNGIMNDPYWSCVVNAKAQAYSFIEWYVDSETNTNVKTVDDLKNIKGDLGVSVAIPGTSDEYEFKFRTQISILSDKTVSKEITDKKDVETAKVTEDKAEVKTTKDKEEEKTPSQDNNKSTQKDTNQKETKLTKKKSNKNTTKEEPVYNEYGYDQYGNYDPNKDLYNDREWNDEDYERWDDIHDDEEPIQEDDNIDPDTGLAKIKDGTHLGEEAERQDMENPIE